jgi:hypothetical protein
MLEESEGFEMNSFEKKVMQWTKIHPDDPLSQYFLESYKESEKVRKEESKKWKQIADALVQISYRTTRASIKEDGK